MIGGMVTSATLTLLVIPAIYALVKGWTLPVPRRGDREADVALPASAAERGVPASAQQRRTLAQFGGGVCRPSSPSRSAAEFPEPDVDPAIHAQMTGSGEAGIGVKISRPLGSSRHGRPPGQAPGDRP